MENISPSSSSSSSSSCDVLNIIIIIPEDVLIQILVLLPVISLLRFKSVCKSWRALIQSSLFIDLHLNTTTTTNKNNKFGSFIFQTSDYVTLWEKKNEAFMLSSSSSSSSAGVAGGGGGDELLLLKLEDLGYPPRYKIFTGSYSDHIFMVGSCNGLICIHDTKGKEVSLWNPATRQFKLLPKPLIPPTLNLLAATLEQHFVAFGYDVKTKDYKVLLISHFRSYNNNNGGGGAIDEYIVPVQVYSLSTDSWRLLEQGIYFFPALPRQPGGCNHGVYLNGSYYFLGTRFINTQLNLMLISFDFTKEIFTAIQQQLHYAYNCLTSFGEKQLAVFEHIRVEEEDESVFETYDIWVLNEEEHVKEEEPWTKLHSRLNCDRRTTRRTPRSISNNGEFVLISADGDDREINDGHVSDCSLLQVFNIVTQEVIKEFPAGRVIRAEVYKQSLVSIIGGNNDTTADT